MVTEAAQRCTSLIVAASAEMRSIVGHLPGIAAYHDRWKELPHRQDRPGAWGSALTKAIALIASNP